MRKVCAFAVVALIAGGLSASGAVTAEVKEFGGAPVLWIDGKPTTGLMHWNHAMTAEDVALFREAGVHLFSVTGIPMMRGADGAAPSYADGFDPIPELTDEKIDELFSLFARHDPEAKVLIRVELKTPEFWRQAHPGELVKVYDVERGEYVRRAWASPASEEYLELAEKSIADTIRRIERKWGDVVFGYHLGLGNSSENVYDWGTVIGDYSEAMAKKWAARHPGAAMPDPETYVARRPRDTRRLLDPQRDASAVDFMRLNSEVMANGLVRLARHAKATLSALGRQKVIGVFYGYTSLPANAGDLFAMGHFAADIVYGSPDIDFIAGPIDYSARQADGASFAQCLPGSIVLHGKLYYAEDDTRLHRAQDEGLCVSGDAATSRRIQLRNFRDAWRQGGSMWWMDHHGSGWYREDSFRDTFGRCQREAISTLASRTNRAALAVFVSEKSFAYERLAPLPAANEMIQAELPEIAALGDYDIYRLEDLPRLEETGALAGVKRAIVLNAHAVEAEERENIRRVLYREGRTVLFLGWPGYIKGNTAAVENITELTGIKVAEVPVNDYAGIIQAQVAGRRISFGQTRRSEPQLVGADPEAETLATFVQGTLRVHPSGQNGAAVMAKEFGGCRVVLALATWLPAEMLEAAMTASDEKREHPPKWEGCE